MNSKNELVKKVWLVDKYEDKDIRFNGYVFDPVGHLLMPNGQVYDLNTKYNRGGELENVPKGTTIVYSLEELFEKFPEAVTWEYINNLEDID